jgi:hypothetical protein
MGGAISLLNNEGRNMAALSSGAADGRGYTVDQFGV